MSIYMIILNRVVRTRVFYASRVCTLDANRGPRPKVGIPYTWYAFYFNTESETQVIEIRALSQLITYVTQNCRTWPSVECTTTHVKVIIK